jgi:hypothetical protein
LVVIGLFFVVSEAQARVVLASRGPRHHRAPSAYEFVLEGGLAEPMGNQKDDFWSTEDGFSSGTGYQLGFRFRQYVGEYFAVSPAFHYTRFGVATGLTDSGNETNLAYNLRTSNYRYGLDLHAFMGDGALPARMFVTGGIALVNNRYRDELQYNGIYQSSVNSPAYNVGLGIKMQNIEIVGEYTFNRFKTNQFSFDGVTQSYNWDALIVRVGLSFGR